MTKEDLRGKTVFDLCKDEKMLQELGYDIAKKKSYDGYPWIAKAQMVEKYAARIGDYDLYKTATALEKDLWKELHEESRRRRCIID
ncbi:MAG: hypothetical protein LUC86_06785 [Prevotellaceae bacterium]|nr:hypothetical protein [Prevotellaceae bacterium]